MASKGIIFRIITQILIYTIYLLWPLITLLYRKERQHISRTTNPLFSCSATEIARKIRRKQVTCEEVIATFIERLEEVNPIINGIVENRFKDAILDAKAVDEYLSNCTLTEDELEKNKPLLGVPVTIKENLSLKGHSLTVGSRLRLGIKATEDGKAVTAYKEAGAIPLCITNTPEFCLSIETYNKVTGTSNNPYNTLYNCGGSSGGEGGLIGSGASVLGLGSDIAGSIRIPSSFNCIFGHKMSPGLVSVEGHFPKSSDPRFNYHLTIGPMVRYSEDLPMATKILAGKNSDRLKLDEPVDLSKIKVLYMEDCGSSFGLIPVQEEIKTAIRKTAYHLRDNCHSNLSDVKFKEFEYSCEIGTFLHMGLKDVPHIFNENNINTYAEFFKCLVGKSDFPFNTLLWAFADKNKAQIPGTVEEVDKDVRQLRAKIIKELGNTGVFLYPSFPTSAIPHMGSMYATIGSMYLLIVNVLGLPSTNVPVGFDKKGLPIGIQVIAAPDQDRLCFAVAKELETLYGGWKPPY